MKIRVELVPKFYMGEDDAVLVAADRDGVKQLAEAMKRAQLAPIPSFSSTNRLTYWCGRRTVQASDLMATN
jgi:hypothetical protein